MTAKPISPNAKPKQDIVCDQCGRKADGPYQTRKFNHKSVKGGRRDYCCSCLDAMPRVEQWHPRKPSKPVAVLNLAQAEERIEELAGPAGFKKLPKDLGKAMKKGAIIPARAFTFCAPGAHGKAVAP